MPDTIVATRRATDITLPEPSLRGSRILGINPSQNCERGLAGKVAAARRQRWLSGNRKAMQVRNEPVTRTGQPLAGCRQF